MAFNGTFGQKKFGSADARFGGPTVTTQTQAALADSAIGTESFVVTVAGGAQIISLTDSAAGTESFKLTLPVTSPPAPAFPAARVEIHDPTTKVLIEVLENAKEIGYELASNTAPMASFTIPRDDPKWPAILAFRECWIYDSFSRLVGIFRVMPTKELDDSSGLRATVSLEGYATVLQDDLVSDEVIWTNQTVTQIISDLLAFQASPRVTLGTIDPSLNVVVGAFRVAYENVMKGCWEVRNAVGGYISVDPDPLNPAVRKLNLLANPGQDIGQRIRTGFNLMGLAKSSDPTQAVTKLYPLGRGEGRNQQRPSTDMLLAQAVDFVAGGGGRSTLTITDRYSRYKGFTTAGAALPNGQTAVDTRVRPMRVLRNGLDDSANWEQGADERTLRSKTNGYNPGGSWTLDYVHADYLIADDTVGTYGIIAQAYPDKRFETSADLIRATRQQLDVAKQPQVSYEIAMLDVARLYPGEDFERITLHDQVNVWNPRLGVATKLRVVKASYRDMWNPESYTIVVGAPDQVDAAVRLLDRQRKYETMADGATNIWVDSFEDNIDSSHPYTRDIYVPPDAVSVNKIALNLRRKAYRYYVSSVVTMSGPHQHLIAPQSQSGTTAWDSVGSSAHTTDAQGGHDHTDPQGGLTGFGPTHSHNVLSHFHLHSHSFSYGVSIITQLEGAGSGHQHTVIVTPGIIETTAPTLIVVSIDGNVASSSSSDLQEFDLTPYLGKDQVGRINRGWHTVTFNGGQGRIQASIVTQVFLQSRGVLAG